MEKQDQFRDSVIVACGTLSMELNKLREAGRLNVRKIIYAQPGLHQRPGELEIQLAEGINKAKTLAEHIIVVYGGKFCYVNLDNPYRDIDCIIDEQAQGGVRIARVKASYCVDMLMSEKDRSLVSQGRDVYWLTPGWVKYKHLVFQGWDKGMANENFPKHSGGAIMLDAVGYFEELSNRKPEEILEFSDWMGIPLDVYPVNLERLFDLLSEAAVSMQ